MKKTRIDKFSISQAGSSPTQPFKVVAENIGAENSKGRNKKLIFIFWPSSL